MNYLEILILGVGLATDASCVCTSNGLVYKPNAKNTFKMSIIYALFQFIMPVIGFLGASMLPRMIYQYNHIIAFLLLVFMGAKMFLESFKHEQRKINENSFTNKLLISQAIATSIDALSVGFAFSGMKIIDVIIASILIAIVTFIMCVISVRIGVYVGDKVNSKAEKIGGIVLIGLGINML